MIYLQKLIKNIWENFLNLFEYEVEKNLNEFNYHSLYHYFKFPEECQRKI